MAFSRMTRFAVIFNEAVLYLSKGGDICHVQAIIVWSFEQMAQGDANAIFLVCPSTNRQIHYGVISNQNHNPFYWNSRV
jgi:hypothetical protein